MTHTWNDLSPLHIACCLFGKGNANMVNLLLEYGADPLQGIDYNQFVRMKQFALEPSPSSSKRVAGRQVGADHRRLPEGCRDSLKTALVFPVDIGVSCRNRDVVAILISKFACPHP